MAYNDETYGNALEQALAKMITRHCVGEMWVGFSLAEKPAGVLLRDASLQSRALYSALWEWASEKGLVKTEEEWQTEYSTNGVCHFYSDGDGSTTFRMPSAPLYIKGAENAGEAGVYIAEGLPDVSHTHTRGSMNITGGISNSHIRNNVGTAGCGYGAVTVGSTRSAYTGSYNEASGSGSWDFDASRSWTGETSVASLSDGSPIYGNSQHVTPATSKLLFGVWAVSTSGVAVPDANVEEILGQVQIVASAASAAQSSADTAKATADSKVATVNGVAPDANGNVEVVIGGAAQADAYIIETWHEGTSWYRKWSDGWIEQGGITSVSKDSWNTVNLLTPMMTTNYNLITQTIASGSNNSQYNNSGEVNTKTTSSFRLYTYNYTKNVYWYAHGF